MGRPDARPASSAVPGLGPLVRGLLRGAERMVRQAEGRRDSHDQRGLARAPDRGDSGQRVSSLARVGEMKGRTKAGARGVLIAGAAAVLASCLLVAGCGSPGGNAPAAGTSAANQLVCKHYLAQRNWVK